MSTRTKATDKKTVMLRSMPSDLMQRAKVAAVKRGITLGQFVAEAIDRALREQKG